MTRKQQRLITFLSLVIMALLILLSRRIWFRVDLTGAKAYTLSPVSRNLRNEIGEDLRITYYLSNKLRSLDPAPGEIGDVLREYEERSRGKIRLTVRDPGSNPQDAERFGLSAQPLQNVEQNEASFSMVYSGIVIEYLDKYEVIPWVFSLDTLEYDVTSRIRALVNGKRRELGVMACEPRKDWNEYYGFMNQALVQSGFSVLQIRPGEEIPDTLPLLMVLGGAEELDEYALYRIDRYIQLGGRVLFAVETVDVDLFETWEARLKNDRGLLAMLSGYGATLGPGLVLDLAALPMPYQNPVTRQTGNIRYAPWVGVLGEFRNPDHILTSRFSGVDLYWASPITLTLPESGLVTGEALFTSTPQAWLMTRDFRIRPEDNAFFTLEQEETAGEKILAAALEGRFPSWFGEKGKPVPETGEWEGDEWETAPGELPDMPAAPRDSRIVVVGDSDIGSFLMQYTQRNQSLNLNFLLEAAGWLGNDDDIVGIRNRKNGSGRLDRITDDAKRAGIMTFSRLLNIVLLPLVIIVFGALRLYRRKHKKEQDHAL
ncbi:MAG: GldG family protein [Treponema sp.]|jgi:ABC-type uncharacterized transport system involved in gliding motility auxiliary subunit|nr:GldG family protein [Treponema sp.]